MSQKTYTQQLCYTNSELPLVCDTNQLFVTPDISAADEWRIKFDCAAKNGVARCIPRDVSQRKKKERPISLLWSTTRRRFDSQAKNIDAFSVSGETSQGDLTKPIPTAGDINLSRADKSGNWFDSGAKNFAALSISGDTTEGWQTNDVCKIVAQTKMKDQEGEHYINFLLAQCMSTGV